MINLLKWLLFPGVLSIGGGGGGGGDTYGAQQAAEEARKAALRKRIDKMYGIGASDYVPDKEKFKIGEKVVHSGGSGGGQMNDTGAVEQPTPGEVSVVPEYDEEAYAKAVEQAQRDGDPEAFAARKAMEGENTRIADATRAYHADRLGRAYTKAERETRFKLARQGLMGGSEDIYQQDEVKSDRDLGATRVDEAVRRAIADLSSKREQERLNAISLVNSGAGDSAVSAAQAGLKNTFEAANSTQRADLFGDLFANTADAATADTLAQQQAALLGRYRDKLGAFFPTRSTSSGRITAT